jgi:hypothetical protein
LCFSSDLDYGIVNGKNRLNYCFTQREFEYTLIKRIFSDPPQGLKDDETLTLRDEEAVVKTTNCASSFVMIDIANRPENQKKDSEIITHINLNQPDFKVLKQVWDDFHLKDVSGDKSCFKVGSKKMRKTKLKLHK